MNTTNLTRYAVPFASELWHKFRTVGIDEKDAAILGCKPYAGGIGASEIGSILGLTKKYRPVPAETFHYKVGDTSPNQNTNKAMLRGKILEPTISVIWQLYSGEQDSWVYNFEDYQNGDRELRNTLAVRKSRKLNAYYVNNQYPWLFASLDYFAEKNTAGILDGKIHPEGFPVEIKSVNQNYARLWLDEIPIYHVVQLNQEMICTNSDYGEIAVLFPDDFSFRIFPFYRDNELCERIIHWSKVFWDKVLESREAKKKMDKFYQEGKLEQGEEQQSIIDSNEPEPDDGEGYLEYIKEKFQPGFNEVIEGDLSLYEDTMRYKIAAGISGKLDEEQTGIKNRILKLLTTTGASQISWGEAGRVTFNEDKNKKRTLLINTKPLYDIKGIVETEFNKIDLSVKR